MEESILAGVPPEILLEILNKFTYSTEFEGLIGACKWMYNFWKANMAQIYISKYFIAQIEDKSVYVYIGPRNNRINVIGLDFQMFCAGDVTFGPEPPGINDIVKLLRFIYNIYEKNWTKLRVKHTKNIISIEIPHYMRIFREPEFEHTFEKIINDKYLTNPGVLYIDLVVAKKPEFLIDTHIINRDCPKKFWKIIESKL